MARIGLVLLVTAAAIAAGETPPMSQADIERFLRTARIVETKELAQGFPHSRRAVLDDGKMKHDAHIQTVNITRAEFEGAPEKKINVRDWYRFNLAAYELDKILDLNMIPPTVERQVDGLPAAVTWWVDDVLMTELNRTRKSIQPPDPDAWDKQMHVVRVFDQLIFNTDRNLGNLLISKGWKLWMIDHTRAFRLQRTVANENLVKCDRKLLLRLRKLNEGELTRKLKPSLNAVEVDAMLARRDAIVKHFDRLIAQQGEQAVLYEDD